MSETSRSKKLTQYRSLLARAMHPDTPKPEAEESLKKAHQFFAKYSFTEDELLTAEEKESGNVVIDNVVAEVYGLYMEQWRLLGLGVSEAFRCVIWAERVVGMKQLLLPQAYYRIHFVGKQADVSMARDFYLTAMEAVKNP